MKYIFFDVDRTLLCRDKEQPYIIDSTKEALKRLQEEGHLVAIATGRNYALSLDYMNEFGLQNMVVDGGNGIVVNGELVEDEPMDTELCRQLLRECEQQGFSYAIVKDTSNHNYSTDERFINNKMKSFWRTIIVDKVDFENIDSFYAIYIMCTKEQENLLPTFAKMTAVRTEVNRTHVETTTKSKGIKKMVDYFHGSYDDVVVFGDGTNDLDMFSQPWLKIAMGNSVDVIKQLADYITDDCNKDGIYNACEKYHWFKD